GFVGPSLPRLVAQVLRENKTVFPSSTAMEKIAAAMVRSQGLCHVWENSSDGLVYTINHGLELSTLAELVDAFIEIARDKAKMQTPDAVPPPAVEMPGNE
ncbi:MAG TPA: hypothetical protein VLQ89_02985, partial [Candidatus Binatia bacterium]|nr:hypothetical protein [Candidatus Binatia bacterium]